MPLYMDVHSIDEVTCDAACDAHAHGLVADEIYEVRGGS
jgi:hypothetical protein